MNKTLVNLQKIIILLVNSQKSYYMTYTVAKISISAKQRM